MNISEIITITSQKFNVAAIKIFSESGLPAYLVEGIVLNLLADVREKKALELTQDLSHRTADLEKKNDQMEKINAELQAQLKDAKEKLQILQFEKAPETGGDKDGRHKQ